MKYLYILGASGSGKTTLAKRLNEKFPEDFHRVVQYTTRQIREGEKNGDDYYYISEEEYDKFNDFFEKVEIQYAPGGRYGGRIHDLREDKWNIVVACIEGLLSGLRNTNNEKIVVLNILCNGKSFVEREGRNISYEETFNKSVIYPFLETNFYDDDKNILAIEENNHNDVTYFEISIDELRKMDDDELMKWISERLNKECSL